MVAIFRDSFQNPLPRRVSYDWFTEAEIASYDLSISKSPETRVDDHTWRDLEIPAYLREVGFNASIYARQVIYARLRRGAISSLPDVLSSHSPQNIQTLLSFTRQTRAELLCTQTNTCAFILGQKKILIPEWSQYLWIAPWLLCAALTAQWLAGWNAVAFSVTCIAYLVFAAWIQVRLHSILEEWRTLRQALLVMLRAAKSLGELSAELDSKVLMPLAHQMPEVKRLTCLLEGGISDRFAFISEYANLLALSEYVNLRKSVNIIERESINLQGVYEALSNCEADICILEHLQSSPQFCIADTTNSKIISFAEIRNPILRDCTPINLDIDEKSLLISGQNGAGKSTLLRAIGINLVTARAFGICYARSAKTPFVTVWTSIANSDSLVLGRSYYMAELQRAEDLLAACAHTNATPFFIIDEIFRGTNHIESVAVAASVLSHIAARAKVIASTHNIILGPLLSTRYKASHLQRSNDGSRIDVIDGSISDTNGISMLEQYNIPTSIRENAKLIHSWYSRFVLTPTEFPDLV